MRQYRIITLILFVMMCFFAFVSKTNTPYKESLDTLSIIFYITTPVFAVFGGMLWSTPED